MDKQISNINGFKLFLEIRDIDMPVGYRLVNFYTMYDHASDPTYKQNIYNVCMTADEFKNFQEIVNAS